MVENLRRMFLAMAQDIRVILIWLDRLHNMQYADHHPPDKQREIARETLDFCSVAHRLVFIRLNGRSKIRRFATLEPGKIL